VEIRQRIEIERLGLNGSHHAEETGEGKPYQQINAKSAENCFRIGFVRGKDTPEHDDHDKYIKNKAENGVRMVRTPALVWLGSMRSNTAGTASRSATGKSVLRRRIAYTATRSPALATTRNAK
jgi:hypothetical protein